MQISVRELVEFSLCPEDLTRGTAVSALQDGTARHKARQKAYGAGWEKEVALSMLVPYIEDEMLTLSGRMDGYKKGEIPEIEEIKSFSGETLPLAPYPAHRAQGVVYGYMLCCLENIEKVVVTICYVDKKGRVLASFSEELTRQACTECFQMLYDNYLNWQHTLFKHRQQRNQSLAGLIFPFETYRQGQREMAVQVFTAIKTSRRLFAEMPTGTGKSAAVLFPSLKALERGYSNQIFYLTARTTQREAAQNCIRLMRKQPLVLWTMLLTAKEKQCFSLDKRCHMEECSYAKGFYLRLPDAINAILPLEDWDDEAIISTAKQFSVCPYEFSLSLAAIADVVICDYNYAFDPAAHLQRVFDVRHDMTLLVDESHNLMPRVRDMLSATVASKELALLKKNYPKRSSAMYKALGMMQRTLREFEHTGIVSPAESLLYDSLSKLLDAILDEIGKGFANDLHFELYRTIKTFLSAQGRKDYAYILEGSIARRKLTAFCLNVEEHIQNITNRMCGVVFFSATLSPLEEIKNLLGGEEEDALFRMPSPYPPENFYVKRLRINTRYTARDETAEQVAQAIRLLFKAKSGKYIAYFPSFGYMEMVSQHLEDLPVLRQERGMDEQARNFFLSHFHQGTNAVLGLCVMGGIFAEGIDLAGDKLLGVMLVGVGLPQVNIFQETLREYFEIRFSNGFRYAYQIPGMHKILQAAGRVIRSEKDKGVAVLIDERYYQRAYEQLCPPHWQFVEEPFEQSLTHFWGD